jgi:hypothetical protein
MRFFPTVCENPQSDQNPFEKVDREFLKKRPNVREKFEHRLEVFFVKAGLSFGCFEKV